MMPFVEETINRWSQRGGKSNVLEQVKNTVNDKKSVARTQILKDEIVILGEESSAVNVYNDHDLYTQLLSDYLAMNDDAPTQETDGEYLYGADLSLTQKYLAKR